MNIYYFESRENQAYLIAPEGDDDRCEPDPPRFLAAEWSSPWFELVTYDDVGRVLPKCDFPAYLPTTVMLSGRAVERLGPLLTENGEILPLNVSNHEEAFYFFNVTRVADAVDTNRSKFMRFPSGRIMKCERLVFDPKAVPDVAWFFKTTQLGSAMRIFATQRAVEAIERTDLTGYEFRLAWSNEGD